MERLQGQFTRQFEKRVRQYLLDIPPGLGSDSLVENRRLFAQPNFILLHMPSFYPYSHIITVFGQQVNRIPTILFAREW